MHPYNAPSRIFGLDLMRAAAIVMVLLAHALWLFPPTNHPLYDLITIAGFFGVEMFFVLSGFLIGRILYREFLGNDFTSRQVMSFLRRRWYRTLPNYYLILLVNIVLALALGYPVASSWRYFFFLQNFASPLLPFFPESWSLSVEEAAYLALPLVLLVAASFYKRTSYVFLATVLFVYALCIFAKIQYHHAAGATSMSDWNIGVKSVVIFRVDAILTGVLCAWSSLHFPVFWKRLRWIGLLSGIVGVGFLTFGVGALGWFINQQPFFWNVVYLPLTSLVFAGFLPALSHWKIGPPVAGRYITTVAILSYSMYLLHYSIVLQLIKHFLPEETSFNTLLAATAVYLIITFLLSALLYRYYEKPMTDLRDRTTT